MRRVIKGFRPLTNRIYRQILLESSRLLIAQTNRGIFGKKLIRLKNAISIMPASISLSSCVDALKNDFSLEREITIIQLN